MIEFVMLQPGCPCCCSQEPVLVSDLGDYSHGIGVGDPDELIPDTVQLVIYEAPWSSLAELHNAFQLEPVTWESETSAWRHITKTERTATVQTHKRVL